MRHTNRMKRYMRINGLTEQGLIDKARLSITRPDLNRIINGWVLPTVPTLAAICETMEVEPCVLYDRRDIDLLHAQELWEQRHGVKSIRLVYGHKEARARLTPPVWTMLKAVLRAHRYETFGDWARDRIAADYSALTPQEQQGTERMHKAALRRVTA